MTLKGHSTGASEFSPIGEGFLGGGAGAHEQQTQLQHQFQDAMNNLGVTTEEGKVQDYLGFENAIRNYEQATGVQISRDMNDIASLLSLTYTPKIEISGDRFKIKGTKQALESDYVKEIEAALNKNFAGQDMTSPQMQAAIEALNKDVANQFLDYTVSGVYDLSPEMYRDYRTNIERSKNPNMATATGDNNKFIGYDKDGNLVWKTYKDWMEEYRTKYSTLERAQLFRTSAMAAINNPEDLYLRTPYLLMTQGKGGDKPVDGFTLGERAAAFIDAVGNTALDTFTEPFSLLVPRTLAAWDYMAASSFEHAADGLHVATFDKNIPFLTESEFDKKLQALMESDVKIKNLTSEEKTFLAAITTGSNWNRIDQNLTVRELLESKKESVETGRIPDGMNRKNIDNLKLSDTAEEYNKLVTSMRQVDAANEIIQQNKRSFAPSLYSGKLDLEAVYAPGSVKAGSIYGSLEGTFAKYWLETWAVKNLTGGAVDMAGISDKIREMSGETASKITQVLIGKGGRAAQVGNLLAKDVTPAILETKGGQFLLGLMVNAAAEFPEDMIQTAADSLIRWDLGGMREQMTPEEMAKQFAVNLGLSAAFSVVEGGANAAFERMKRSTEASGGTINIDFEQLSRDVDNVRNSYQTKTLGVDDNGHVTYKDASGATQTLENVNISDLYHAAEASGDVDAEAYIREIFDKYKVEHGGVSSEQAKKTAEDIVSKYANSEEGQIVMKQLGPGVSKEEVARGVAIRKEFEFLDQLRRQSVAESYLKSNKNALIKMAIDPSIENYARYKGVDMGTPGIRNVGAKLKLSGDLIDEAINIKAIEGNQFAKDLSERFKRAEREASEIEEKATQTKKDIEDKYPGLSSYKELDPTLSYGIATTLNGVDSTTKMFLGNQFSNLKGGIQTFSDADITGTSLEYLKNFPENERTAKFREFMQYYADNDPDTQLYKINNAVYYNETTESDGVKTVLTALARKKLDMLVENKAEIDPAKTGYSGGGINEDGYIKFNEEHIERAEGVTEVGERLAISIFQPGGPVDRINPLLRDGTMSNEALLDYLIDYIPKEYNNSAGYSFRIQRVLGDNIVGEASADFYRGILTKYSDDYKDDWTKAQALTDDEVIALIKEELRPAINGTHRPKEDIILYRAANDKGNMVNKAAKGGLEFVTGETDKFTDAGGMFVSMSPKAVEGYADGTGTGFFMRLHIPKGTGIFAFSKYGFGNADGGAFIMAPQLDSIVMNVDEFEGKKGSYPQFELYVGEGIGQSNEIALSAMDIPQLSQQTLDLSRPRQLSQVQPLDINELGPDYSGNTDYIYLTTPLNKDEVLVDMEDTLTHIDDAEMAVNGYNTRGDMFVITDLYPSKYFRDEDMAPGWKRVDGVTVSNNAIMTQKDVELVKKDVAEFRNRIVNLPYADEIMNAKLDRNGGIEQEDDAKINWDEFNTAVADLKADVKYKRIAETLGKEGADALEKVKERYRLTLVDKGRGYNSFRGETLQKALKLLQDESNSLYDVKNDLENLTDIEPDGLLDVISDLWLLEGDYDFVGSQAHYLNKQIYNDGKNIYYVNRSTTDVYNSSFEDSYNFNDRLKEQIGRNIASTNDPTYRETLSEIITELEKPRIDNPIVKTGDELMHEWNTIDDTKYVEAPDADSPVWEEPTEVATRFTTESEEEYSGQEFGSYRDSIRNHIAEMPIKRDLAAMAKWVNDGVDMYGELYTKYVQPEFDRAFPTTSDKEAAVRVWDFIFNEQKRNNKTLNDLVGKKFSVGDVEYDVTPATVDFYINNVEPFMEDMRKASAAARGVEDIESTVGYLPHTDYDPMDFTSDEAFERGVLFKKYTGASTTVDGTFSTAKLSPDLPSRLDIFARNMFWDMTGDGLFISKFMEEIHADTLPGQKSLVTVDDVENMMKARKKNAKDADGKKSTKEFMKSLSSDSQLSVSELNKQANADSEGVAQAIHDAYKHVYKDTVPGVSQMNRAAIPYATFDNFAEKTISGGRPMRDWGVLDIANHGAIAQGMVQRLQNGDNLYVVITDYLTRNGRRTEKGAEYIAKKWMDSLAALRKPDGTVDARAFQAKLSQLIKREGRNRLNYWIGTAELDKFSDATLKRMNEFLFRQHMLDSALNDAKLQNKMTQAVNWIIGNRMKSMFWFNFKSATNQLTELIRLPINVGAKTVLNTTRRLVTDVDFKKRADALADSIIEKTDFGTYDTKQADNLAYAIASNMEETSGGGIRIKDFQKNLKEFGLTVDKIAGFPMEFAENTKNRIFIATFLAEAEAKGIPESEKIYYILNKYHRYALAADEMGKLGVMDSNFGRLFYNLQSFQIREVGMFLRDIEDLNGVKEPISYIFKNFGYRMGMWMVLSALGLGGGILTMLGLDPFDILSERYTGIDEEDEIPMDKFMNSPIARFVMGGGFMSYLDDIYFGMRKAYEGEHSELTPEEEVEEARKHQGASIFDTPSFMALPSGEDAASAGWNTLLGFIPGYGQYKKFTDMWNILERGYETSQSGNIKYEAPSDPLEIAKGLLFGKSTTRPAQEYNQEPNLIGGLVEGGIPGLEREIDRTGRTITGGFREFDPIDKENYSDWFTGESSDEQQWQSGYYWFLNEKSKIAQDVINVSPYGEEASAEATAKYNADISDLNRKLLNFVNAYQAKNGTISGNKVQQILNVLNTYSYDPRDTKKQREEKMQQGYDNADDVYSQLGFPQVNRYLPPKEEGGDSRVMYSPQYQSAVQGLYGLPEEAASILDNLYEEKWKKLNKQYRDQVFSGNLSFAEKEALQREYINIVREDLDPIIEMYGRNIITNDKVDDVLTDVFTGMIPYNDYSTNKYGKKVSLPSNVEVDVSDWLTNIYRDYASAGTSTWNTVDVDEVRRLQDAGIPGEARARALQILERVNNNRASISREDLEYLRSLLK